MRLLEHLRLENLVVDMQQSKVRIVKVKGKEGSDGKQKEEEEDSIGRGISERWFNESMRQYRIRERENNENNMGGSENEETFFYFYFFSVVYFFLTKLKYSTLYPFT